MLTAPTTAGTANLTARASAGDPGKTAAVMFTGDPATARVVILTPGSTTGLANGVDTIYLSATVEDVNGNRVGAGVTVNWGTDLGSMSTNASNTNSSGIATAMLIAPTVPGTATVTARASAADPGRFTSIVFSVDLSQARVVRVTPSKAEGRPDGVDTVTLTAKVEDAHGNNVGAGVTVNWETSRGTLATSTSTTDANSLATVVLTASTASGTASITGRANAFDPGAFADVVFRPPTLSLALNSSTINGNNVATSLATVTAKYHDGTPYVGQITIDANAGQTIVQSGASTITMTTNASGQASASIRSARPGTTASIFVTAPGAAGSAPLYVNNFGVTWVTASPSSVLANGTAATLTAMVAYPDGTPAVGASVFWSTGIGSLGASATYTGGDGRATNSISSGAAGSTTITASSGNRSGNAGMTFITPEVCGGGDIVWITTGNVGSSNVSMLYWGGTELASAQGSPPWTSWNPFYSGGYAYYMGAQTSNGDGGFLLGQWQTCRRPQ